MSVVDASIVAAAVLRDRRSEAARRIIHGERGGLEAPHLIDAEVGHALHGQVRGRKIEASHAEAFLADLKGLPLARFPHDVLLANAWQMRSRVSFYDALYLALAKLLDVPVLTFDKAMARAGRGFGVETEVPA